jgi:threonine dehydratase
MSERYTFTFATSPSPTPAACRIRSMLRMVCVVWGPTPVITDEMYPLLKRLVDDIVLVSDEEVVAAMRRLALGDKLVTEGAGAAAVAAALATPVGERGLSVCIVSGWSVDRELLARVLRAEPRARTEGAGLR